MATRTRKKKPAVQAGRDTYHVIGPNGELRVKGEAAHALVAAQKLVNTELTVERRSLFGPAATLYRVVRDASTGTIYTFTVNAED